MTSTLPLIFWQNIAFSLLQIFPQEDLSAGLTINCRAASEPKAPLSVVRPDCLHHRHIKWANELKHINFCLCSSFMWIYSLKKCVKGRHSISICNNLTKLYHLVVHLGNAFSQIWEEKYENERAKYLILIIPSLAALLKVSVLSPGL